MTDTTASAPTLRRFLAIATFFLPVAAVLGSYSLWKNELPAELSSHWSITGQVDGVMAVSQFLTVTLVMTIGGALAGIIAGAWPGLRAATRRNIFFLAGFIAGLGALTWLVSAALTTRAETPYAVVIGAWSVLGLAAIGYGLIPFSLAPRPHPVTHDVSERIDLAPGEGSAWSRTIAATMFLWVAAAMVPVGIALYAVTAATGDLADSAFGLIVVAVVIALLVSFSRFTVTVDWRGLRVVSSLLRLPIKRIPLSAIDTVETAELKPLEWGGWGYRASASGTALILRKGPGLILTTTNGKRFALTLDNPEVPAALLATLRDINRTAAPST